jgi:hypothetical protein
MIKRIYLIGLVLVLIVFSISAATAPSIPIDKPEKDKTYVDPTGLDPEFVKKSMIANSLDSSMTQPSGSISDDGFFYACEVFDPYPVVRWELETGEGKETLATSGENQYFLSGGTYSSDEIWYGCEYNTGGLWMIDPDTGDMENIGGGGTSVNGLAWDPVYNRLYGIGSGGLYEYDPETGEQEFIGSTGQSSAMICLVIDTQGVAWSYDVKFSANSILYNVDLETGECTEYCDMGQNLLYAQDGDLDYDTGILWMAAYSDSSFYAYWDWDAREIVTVSTLDSEYACAMIKSCCGGPESDVGVKAIHKPTQSGHAVPEMEMELLVKNFGNTTETFDAQMEIIKCESSGSILLGENFSSGIPADWETDFWQTSDTNNASGTVPEARVNKYWQSGGGQYYDNYIQTKPFDATGWEKILIKFRWAFEAYSNYGQYCNFYVKYRNDEDSPWEDVTPWNNPLGGSYEGDLWEVSRYDFYEEFGENFSIRFEYIGYYYYYDNIFLDDLHVEGCGGCAEYSEIEEDITLAPGEETIVEFPDWTPSEWQNESFQDTWESYPIHGFTILWGDQNPCNDHKWHLLELYYPWFYDIEITEIGSPSEGRSIPAQTFDVEATITNVGQFPACCIGIDIEIGGPTIFDTLLKETEWPTTGAPGYYLYYPGYGSGWRDEHKSINYYYGWEYRDYSPMAGGDAPEAMARYYRLQADRVFMSPVFDSSDYDSLQLSFLSFIDHFSGSGLYALEAGYTLDGENWYAAWHEEPSGNGNYEVEVPIEGGSATTQVGFWIKGNPYYMDYWHIDNVKVEAVGILEAEWSDSMCQGDDIYPGQSRVFNFDPWTPAFLEEETTAWEVPYKVIASIDVKVDQDPGNNIMNNDIKLDFWHDPALHSVVSPTDRGGDLLWENGDPDGRNGLSGSVYYGNENLIVDDCTIDDGGVAYGGHISLVWNSGAGIGNLDTLYMYFFEDEPGEDCEPYQDEYAFVEVTDFTERLTGDYYFGRPEVEITVEFEETQLAEGHQWVGFMPDSVGEDIAYLLTAENKGCEVMADLPYWGVPRWTPGSHEWGDTYDLAWQLFGDVCSCPYYKAYIQPGTESIDAVAINLGTFNELDLTCTAEIWEYITDPENGTKQYEDMITDIDLDEPLGGTVQLAFDDFNFEYEGRYGLFLAMPDTNGDDDFPKNNNIRWGIAVDDTKPVSSHTLNPADPDGENGWYVNDLEVTLMALDPLSNDVSSGADYINYRVNDGPIQTIEGSIVISGTFLITQADEKEDVKVEYWAVDNVGNVEDSNILYIDMDQTDPTVDLTYEVVSGNPIQGWVLEFTATCSDHTSGMGRVEFYLNEILQSVVSGSGPTYQWSFIYHGGLNINVRADAFDIAGNLASDIIENAKPTSYNIINQDSLFKVRVSSHKK